MGIELIGFRLAFCRLEGRVSFTSLSLSFFWFIINEISRCLFKIYYFWLCCVQAFHLIVTSRGFSLVVVLGASHTGLSSCRI